MLKFVEPAFISVNYYYHTWDNGEMFREEETTLLNASTIVSLTNGRVKLTSGEELRMVEKDFNALWEELEGGNYEG